MGVNQGQIRNGPTPGTPPPPTTDTPGSNPGGRPSSPGGGSPSLGGTMAKWRQGVFTPPPPPATVGSPLPARAGGAASGPGPVSPQPQTGAPAAPTPTSPGTQGAPASPGMVPGASVVGMTTLPTVPQPHEVDQLTPGSYQTPIGTLVKAADGSSKVVLNEQGVAQYRQRFAEGIRAFGSHPFANDPNAPPPPVNPGGVSYNPFSNAYSGHGITPSAPGGGR